MIRFTAPLQMWTSADGNWHFVTVPEDFAGEIKAHAFANPRGFRSVKVEVSLGEIVWRTSVFPMKSGEYFLPIKAASRIKAGLSAGDDVIIALELL